MPAGRPRTISLSPSEMIKLGKEMVKWVTENDPLHLSQFYCILKGYTDAEWDTMHVCQEFFPYYEQALKIIGIKYLDKNSNVRDGISQRWQTVYFKDLKKVENELLKLKAELAKSQDQQADAENVIRKLAQVVKSAEEKDNECA